MILRSPSRMEPTGADPGKLKPCWAQASALLIDWPADLSRDLRWTARTRRQEGPARWPGLSWRVSCWPKWSGPGFALRRSFGWTRQTPRPALPPPPVSARRSAAATTVSSASPIFTFLLRALEKRYSLLTSLNRSQPIDQFIWTEGVSLLLKINRSKKKPPIIFWSEPIPFFLNLGSLRKKMSFHS